MGENYLSIPDSALRGRIQGAEKRRDSYRRHELRMEHEEKCIVEWCKRSDDWGFLLKLGTVKGIIESPVKKGNDCLGFQVAFPQWLSPRLS